MRVGFVGLSTPIFYDYKVHASKAPSDQSSSPNPVLDSPMGLLLLFDEIWFLCRSLCPENMRELPYVHFLDEEKLLPRLDDIQFPDLLTQIKSDPVLGKRYKRLQQSFSFYRENVKRLGIHWESATDNHTHGLKIGSITTSGNSVSAEKVQFDLEVARRLSKKQNVELITNAFSERWLEDPAGLAMKARLAELLVIEDIPNYLTPYGPYDPCVEEARDNAYLKDFRKWIAQRGIPSEGELKDVKQEVEHSIAEAQRKLFLKHYDAKTEYQAIGKTLLGFATDLIPGASAVMSAVELASEAKELVEKRSDRWQAFLVSFKKWDGRRKSSSK